jgi:IclR family transcriptional regulator, KDG regulon repressor
MTVYEPVSEEVAERGPKGSRPRAVERALVLLQVMGYSGVPLRLTDLSRATHLSKATVSRMLSALIAHEFVTKLGPGYTLGKRFLQLATPVEAGESNGLKRHLLPYLLELYEHTHGAVSLAILYHSQVRYCDVLHSHNHWPAAWRYLEAIPAHHTAAGKVLLAYKPALVDWLTSDEVTGAPNDCLTELDELSCELSTIRSRGLAYGEDEDAPQVVEVAAPVFGAAGRALAALSVSGPSDQLDLRTAAVHATRVARDASAHLQRPQPQVPVKRTRKAPA